MADEFKTRIINNYANDYLKIIDFIIANNELNFYTTSFFYVFKKEILCFCISNNMIKKIFEQTYDQSKHFEFAVTHKRIIEDFYIFKLSEKLKNYIKNCL